MKYFYLTLVLLFCRGLTFGQNQSVNQVIVETGPAKNNGAIHVLMDSGDHSKVKEIELLKHVKNAYVVLKKSGRQIDLDKGCIEFSAFVEDYLNVDSSHIDVYVDGVRGRQSVVGQLAPLNDWLNGSKKGLIQVLVPFEQKLDSIRVFIQSKGSNHIRLHDLKIKVTAGEFGADWQNNVLPEYLDNDSLIIKLANFGRIWGLLKYFSPHISEADINWDMALLPAVNSLMREPTRGNYNKVIQDLISEAGISRSKIDLTRRHKTGLPLNLDSMDADNRDFSWIDQCRDLNQDLKRSLKNAVHNYAAFRNKYVTTPEDDPSLGAPLFHEESYNKNLTQPLNFRLLTLFRYWNIIEYYYPYKQHIKNEFERSLKKYIPVFMAANSSKKYGKALIELNASIKDVHSLIPISAFNLSSYLFSGKTHIYPFTVMLDSMNHAIISKIDTGFQSITGIAPGSQLLRFNNRSVGDILDTFYSGISAGRDEMKNYAITRFKLFSFLPQMGETFEVKLKTGQAVINKELKYSVLDIRRYSNFLKEELMNSPMQTPSGASMDSTRFVSNGLLYINPRKFSLKDTASLLKMLERASHVIIDCRVYPSMEFIRKIVPWFLKDGTPWVQYKYVSGYPGLLKSMVVKNNKEDHYYYPNNVILLISNETMSRSELLTMNLQARKEKIISVGAKTAGADGNVTTIPMIGFPIISLKFSGLMVLYPNGLDTHGTGIAPDYYLPVDGLLNQTIAGIKANRFKFPAGKIK